MSPLGGRKDASLIPGYDAFSFVSFDPVSKEAVRFIREVAGLSEFGIRFPFNNASTTQTTISAPTNLTGRVNYYDELIVNSTLTVTVSVPL